MKNKRKLTAVLLTSAMLTSSLTAGAASSVAANGFDIAGDGLMIAQAPVGIQMKESVTEAGIWYNGRNVAFEDGVNAKNIDGRVMLPFRTVFEMMGAQVDYDETANTVTAVRNDKKVFIDISDSAIYTETDGVRQKVDADVPFVMENDRILVPVRFVGEAMDIEVAWEDGYQYYMYEGGELFEETGTVYLVDFDRYMQELSENAPNLSRLFKMDLEKNKEYQALENGSILFSYDSNQGQWTEKGAVEIKYTGETRYIDEKTQANVVIDVEQSGFEKILQNISNEKIDLNQLKGLTFDVIYDGELVYFRTNLVSLLVNVLPDNEHVKKAAAIANEGMWYSIEIKGVLENLLGKTLYQQIERLVDSMKAGNSITAEEALRQSFKMQMENEWLGAEYIAEGINEAFAVYAMLDDNIAIDGEDDDNCTISITVNKDFIKKAAKMSGMQYLDPEDEAYQKDLEELQADLDAELAPFIYDIIGKIVIKDGISQESSVQLKIGYNNKEQNNESGYFDILFQMNANAQTDTDSTVEPIVIPENSVDFEFLLNLLTQSASHEA